MKCDRLFVNFLSKAYRLAATFVCLVALTLGWQSVFTTLTLPAMAGNDMVQYEQRNAQEQIDQAFGAGTSDQIGGQIDQALGNAQRQFGKASGQLEGATRQFQGQAKQRMGQAKSAVDQASSEVQEQGGNLIDSVKDFFN